jgi:RNA polymerase sigma factor for flagellar operon FliA
LNRSTRDALVLDFLPVVGYMVSDVCGRSSYVTREDLASAGSLALVACADSYDPDLGVPFNAYARIRVKGAIADEMRRQDWASRSTRRRIKDCTAVSDALTARLGRTPTIDELAGTLGVDRAEAEATMNDAARTVLSLDDVVTSLHPSSSETPEEAVLALEAVEHMREAVNALPEKMRYVIEQIYFEDRSVTELADELGTSHVAVSQHRTEAVRLLHDGMTVHHREHAPVRSKGSAMRLETYLNTVAEKTHGGVTRSRRPVAVAA